MSPTPSSSGSQPEAARKQAVVNARKRRGCQSKRRCKSPSSSSTQSSDGYIACASGVFPGQAIIRDRAKALEYAKSVYKQSDSAGELQHHIFWCDGARTQKSTPEGAAVYCGAAVVHKKVHNSDNSDQNWVFHGFGIEDPLGTDDTELFAIGMALKDASARLCMDRSSPSSLTSQSSSASRSSSSDSTAQPSEIVTVLTDSQAATQLIQKGPRTDMDVMSRNAAPCRPYLTRMVISLAKQLHDAGVETRITWVPGHSHIAGQEKADKMAVASRRFMEYYHMHHMTRSADGTVQMVDVSVLEHQCDGLCRST